MVDPHRGDGQKRGRTCGRQRAVFFMAASERLFGRLRAGSHGRRHICVLWRTIRPGQGVTHSQADGHERRRPRDSRRVI